MIQSLRPDIDVVIIVTADLHNKLGETQVGRVILGTYTSETIQRINFANFDPNNVFDTEVGDIITYTMQACELTYYC